MIREIEGELQKCSVKEIKGGTASSRKELVDSVKWSKTGREIDNEEKT